MILLVGVFLVLDQYRDREAGAQSVESAQSKLRAANQKLSAEQQLVTDLQAQIDDIQAQRHAKEVAYEELTAGHTQWHAAISTLWKTQVPGVTFESVNIQVGGRLILDGTATDIDAMVKFQIQLSDVSPALDLQTLQWEETSESFEFTAAFNVEQ